MNGIWKEMGNTYRELGFSEDEMAKRIICKTTKVTECKGNLDECDK